MRYNNGYQESIEYIQCSKNDIIQKTQNIDESKKQRKWPSLQQRLPENRNKSLTSY